jgi:hypothetical protein
MAWTSRAAAFTLCAHLLIAAAPGGATDTILPPGGTFSDDDGNIHEADIDAIATAGITRGCNPPANTHFCPDQPSPAPR